MDVKDIINKGRPVGLKGECTFEELATELAEYNYKSGVHDGYDYALEEFENNRLKACETQTPEEAERESAFVVPFVKEHHRTPTFSDAIEATRKQIIDKICKWLEEHLYDEAYTFRDNEGTWIDIESVISDLKKAIEE